MVSIWVLLTYRGVSFSFITFVSDLFVFRPYYSLSSVNFCSICCSSCGVLAHMSLSSAKRRWLRYPPSIFKPLVFQVIHRNMPSSAAVNSLSDMVSPCRTPLMVFIFLLSFCRWTVVDLCRFPSRVRCIHLLSLVLEARSVLLEFALSRKLSRSRRKRCRVGNYIIGISPSVGLRHGCGLYWISGSELSLLSWLVFECLL